MKYSRQREMIRETLLSGTPHPTADEVYAQLRPVLPDLSLGTVYRNLNLLVACRELVRLTMPGGSDRFDANVEEHGHTLCSVCGQVADCALPPLDALDRAIEAETGMAVESHQILVTGTCAACLAQNEPGPA